jgi:MFS family permease
MYSEADLQSAVTAGAISREAAEALRAHAAGMRSAPVADEEHFRLITGFNDIFVTIAAVLLLVACAGIGDAVAPGVAGLLIAAAAWGLAEFFTRRRRMALPSIVLLLAFVGGVAGIPINILAELEPNMSERSAALIGAGIGLLAAGAAWLHWRRFMVPITVAAGTAALVVTVIALIVSMIPRVMIESDPETVLLPMVFLAGLGVFSLAMRWDMSDPARETRRSDVAFWLHLLSAPMIAHPLFAWLGVSDGENIGGGAALGVLGVYVLMGVVALAVDRRALLVSALAYVLVALTWLFDQFGMVEINVALTGLIIGSALLTLSAFWAPIRHAVVKQLPASVQSRVPVAAAALPA